MVHEPLKLRFAGALVEQLGAQMYPSATATVAELISNSWDADARNVWVTIPFGSSWSVDGEIIVLDDGHGMTREEAQIRYLDVGRKRRVHHGGASPSGRPVHGRKGIGKLAAFGTAEILDCYTVKDGQTVSFRLDYNAVRRGKAGDYCELEENLDQEPLTTPDGTPLSTGTRIRLTSLRLKRAIPKDQFIKSMSRRFAIDQADMKVNINGQSLQRFDMELALTYPRDNTPDDCELQPNNWGLESLPNGKPIRWWIGFTPKPIKAEYLRGISLLARGKMLQRPFMFERSQGTTGQLGQEYIVGEVVADWLDTGVDIEDDLIQTNRDQLLLEDERLNDLLEWGQRRIAWALIQRLGTRRKKAVQSINDPIILALISDFTETEQRHLIDIAKHASEIGDPDPDQMLAFMEEIVTGFKDKAVRELMERVRVEDNVFQTSFWGLVREFSLIDARKNYSLIRARLQTIERLDHAIKVGATEVPEVHEIIREFPWLLDPRWSLLGDEIDLDDIVERYDPTIDEETGDRLDFLFALKPQPPAPADEILVVEIKRGRKSNGRIHRANDTEVNKFHLYVLGVRDHYSRGSQIPTVSGVMIANNYTDRANRLRLSLQGVQGVKLEFQTWDSVIENTHRLHTGWLEVTRRATRSGDE